MSKSSLVKITLNSLLGLALILIWLRFVNLNQILKTLTEVNLIRLSPVLSFMILSPIIRALRLKTVLNKVKAIKLLDLVFLNGAAMMLNFFIPIRAGELAKGVFLHTHYQLPLGKSIIWIFLDRFVDFLAVLGLAAILVVIVPSRLGAIFAITLGVIFLIATLLTYLIVYKIDFTQKLVKFLRPLLIFSIIKLYFDRLISFFLETFSVLKKGSKEWILISLLTILAYGADAGIWYTIFAAFQKTQPFLQMYLGQLLSALTYLIPAAPGYVGSAEASGLLILSGVLGIEANLASAMTVLFHILSAIFVIFYGLISVFNLKLDLRLVVQKAFRR